MILKMINQMMIHVVILIVILIMIHKMINQTAILKMMILKVILVFHTGDLLINLLIKHCFLQRRLKMLMVL